VLTHPYFFLASWAWNFGLGMTWLAIPLYARSQGLSNGEIGVLFAAPVLAQAPLNLIGGAYTDRIGGRRLMLASCWAQGLAAVWLVFAEGFWMLMVGQLVLVLSRAAFWPANWSMASELPGARGVQLGRLNAVTNVGQILGTALSGFLLAGAGFPATFAVLAASALVAFLVALGTDRPPRRAPHHGRGMLAGYLPLLRKPVIFYCVVCAYLSALPFSLSISFYPLLLAHYAYSEASSGMLVSLRAVGSIAASLLVARFVRGGAETLWPVVCGLIVAASIGLLPVVNHPAPIAVWLLLVGAGSAAMTLYFQITIAEASGPEQRGSALALGGLGWSVSHLSTPLIMGGLADRYGLVHGFYAVGLFAAGGAIAVALLRNWAFRRA
jgi:MFS family permease